LAHVSPDGRIDLRTDLRLIREAVEAGVVPSRAAAANSAWGIWQRFCHTLGTDPYLGDGQDPLLLVQIFAQRYRDGRIAPSHHSVRSRTVEDAVRAVGQGFTRLGAPDPRLTSNGKLDFRLQRQLAGYAKADPPPKRVKPIPLSIVMSCLGLARAAVTVSNCAVADMICLAFFFLLRPGEYTGATTRATESAPFLLEDVQLFIGRRRLAVLTCSDLDLDSATFVSLTFTNQKNSVRGEVIGLALSGSIDCCPVKAVVRRIHALRADGAIGATPLASYRITPGGRWSSISAANITDSLRLAVALHGPSVGFLPTDISASALRAGGAMALLCAQVDTNLIRLLGRWRSDTMLRYLHLQAQPVMRDFSRIMLHGGQFSLIPGPNVPIVPEFPNIQNPLLNPQAV
jgi:hypothetical protein